jgi:hypothetical protein
MSTLPPDASGTTHKTLAKRARHEFVQYFVVSAYLYVCFGVLLLYKAAILHSQGIEFAPYGVAIVKALILGKFIVIGLALGVGGRGSSRRLVFDILLKSVIFLLLLIVLSVVEEIVVGLIHGRRIQEALAGIGGGTLPEVLATSLLLLLVLIPYFGIREIALRLGEGEMMKLLTARQPGPADARPSPDD